MNANSQRSLPVLNRSKFKGWIICCTVLFSFVAGWMLAARVMRQEQVRADSHHVFELMVYHTKPGKASALEAIFRDDSKIMATHGLNVIGFWVPNENPAWKDTFVYVVDFPSREEATKRWREIHADPASRQYIEAAKPILEMVGGEYRVDEIYMRPTDFSAMK